MFGAPNEPAEEAQRAIYVWCRESVSSGVNLQSASVLFPKATMYLRRTMLVMQALHHNG